VRVVRSVSKELARRHKVTVFTTSALDHRRDFGVSPTEVKLDGYRVVYFPRIFKFTRLNISTAMTRMLRQTLNEYDIVHLHSWRHFQDIIVNYYAKSHGVPYVLQVHGSLPRIMAKQRLKLIYDTLFGYRLLKDASKVIALSQMEAEHFKGMGVPEEKITVIPNGIDLPEYVDLPPKGCFQKKFGVDGDEKIVLYLGRIHKTKGIDFLVKAYAYLTKNMKRDDAILVIAGSDDGYLAEARQMANRLKIADKVMFTRMLSEKEKISAYVDSSIVVNVEPTNVFGLVPLEAAACSKPVIVSKGNAISEIVRRGKFGFSVKYDDVNELAENIDKMLNNDELLREIGRKGRKFVFENCNWANVVTKLEKVYEEAVRR